MLREGFAVLWRVNFCAPALFVLSRRTKRMGSKKRFFGCGGNRKKRADRGVRPYGCGGRSEERADRVVRPYMVRRKIGGTGGQGRPPLRVRWEIGGCNDVLLLLPDPHPSASQTPSPEGKAIRCGGDGRTGSSAPTGAAEDLKCTQRPICRPVERLRIGEEAGRSRYADFGVSRKWNGASFF